MKVRWFALAAACAMAVSPAVPVQATAGPVVHTWDGALRGTTGNGYRTFDGIPYAAPPVGRLRWVAPQAAAPWPGVRDASKPGSPCPQQAGEVPGGSANENCLFLNVTAPAAARPGRPQPVIVWVHGGGFTTGAGSSYDPHRMATRGNVVVVTINYRLGELGFLGQPGLPGSGTFGLADQQAALRWVRANIGAFGGDAHNVTLAGESAGGFNVCAQLASPSAAGLFDRAIVESGPCTGEPERPFAPSAEPAKTANADGKAFAAKLGCGTTKKGMSDPADRIKNGGSPHDASAQSVMACLRGTNVSRLLAKQSAVQPAYGTPLLPRAPGSAVADGRFHHVPVLIGNNHDEGNGWAAAAVAGGDTITHQNWPDTVASFFPKKAQAKAVVAAYPVTGTHGGPVFGAMLGDWNFACPTIQSGKLLTARVPTWEYEFADEHAPSTTPSPPFPLGAPHASELPYLFDLGGKPRTMTPAQHRLANTMIDYWTRFARTGNPNGSGTPHWAQRTVQSLAPEHVGAKNTAAQHRCGLWNTINAPSQETG
jgi:para-nitrobenzyl esterase